MYAPYFFQHEQMNIKDMIEGLKALEEWQKSQKPKEEKKKDDPDKWGPLDYITLVFFINALVVPVGAVALMWAATDFMKAIPHP